MRKHDNDTTWIHSSVLFNQNSSNTNHHFIGRLFWFEDVWRMIPWKMLGRWSFFFWGPTYLHGLSVWVSGIFGYLAGGKRDVQMNKRIPTGSYPGNTTHSPWKSAIPTIDFQGRAVKFRGVGFSWNTWWRFLTCMCFYFFRWKNWGNASQVDEEIVQMGGKIHQLVVFIVWFNNSVRIDDEYTNIYIYTWKKWKRTKQVGSFFWKSKRETVSQGKRYWENQTRKSVVILIQWIVLNMPTPLLNKHCN